MLPMFLHLCVLWAKNSIPMTLETWTWGLWRGTLACLFLTLSCWAKSAKTILASVLTPPPTRKNLEEEKSETKHLGEVLPAILPQTGNAHYQITGTTIQTGAALTSRQSGSICCSGFSKWLCYNSCCNPAQSHVATCKRLTNIWVWAGSKSES